MVKSHINNLALEGRVRYKSLLAILLSIYLSYNSHHAFKNPFPRNEKEVEQLDVDLTQVVSRQAQLEEMMEDTNQAVHTIK